MSVPIVFVVALATTALASELPPPGWAPIRRDSAPMLSKRTLQNGLARGTSAEGESQWTSPKKLFDTRDGLPWRSPWSEPQDRPRRVSRARTAGGDVPRELSLGRPSKAVQVEADKDGLGRHSYKQSVLVPIAGAAQARANPFVQVPDGATRLAQAVDTDSPPALPEDETDRLPEALPFQDDLRLEDSPPRPDFGAEAQTDDADSPPTPLRDLDAADDRMQLPDPSLPTDRLPEDEPLLGGGDFRLEVDRADEPKRDCGEEAAACQAEMAEIRRTRISDISLDITPSFDPQQRDVATVNQIRDETLARSPIRSWRNRQGQLIAQGRLQDYRQGSVYVETTDGRLRAIPQQELGADEWCFLTSWWDLPAECRLGEERYRPRDWMLTTFTWTASAVCHKPLYFGDVQLERYGHSAGPVWQPLLSGAHFFGSVLVLPYKVGLNPPTECLYALGYYRPGSCAPWLVHGIPLSTRAIKAQALALGAAITLFP